LVESGMVAAKQGMGVAELGMVVAKKGTGGLS
jgi:hypothetical protein